MNVLNKLIVATIPAIPRPIVRRFASRYIAGEELSDAIRTVRSLNEQGMMATLDLLGEDIHVEEEAVAARDNILRALRTITDERLDSNISVKLTQLGLKLDRTFCLANTRSIAELAKSVQRLLRIDMEDSSCTDDTLWVYRQLRKEFSNVGIVLQAYLHRTYDDAEALMDEGLNNFRLCKGIYVEPEAIAFKGREAINANFLRVLRRMFERKAYVGIATHDSRLIDGASAMVGEFNRARTDYEFQMLLGVRPDLRGKILRNGHRLRLYVPYGRHWYQYSTRRFKENPEIAGYVLKSLLSVNRVN
jgi:proline dehydrogenase